MITTFNPFIYSISSINGRYDANAIKNEPMIFSGDYIFTRENCGPLTSMILDDVYPRVKHYYDDFIPLNVVIDTRVNMLMREQYPSIPGWHCDDVPRVNGQPDMSLIDRNVQHFMVLLSTGNSDNGVSGTEFITLPRAYDIDSEQVWHSLDVAANNDESKTTRKVQVGEVVMFDQSSIHRATPATENGWRMFFRLSVTHRAPWNEIRNQVQIYCDMSKSGW